MKNLIMGSLLPSNFEEELKTSLELLDFVSVKQYTLLGFTTLHNASQQDIIDLADNNGMLPDACKTVLMITEFNQNENEFIGFVDMVWKDKNGDYQQELHVLNHETQEKEVYLRFLGKA